jgi:hypothetical protein
MRFNQKCFCHNEILNFAAVKLPNTSPASKRTQHEASLLSSRDGIVFLQAKKIKQKCPPILGVNSDSLTEIVSYCFAYFAVCMNTASSDWVMVNNKFGRVSGRKHS